MKIRTLLITTLFAFGLSSVTQAESKTTPAMLAAFSNETVELMSSTQQAAARGEYSKTYKGAALACFSFLRCITKPRFDHRKGMWYVVGRNVWTGRYTIYNH